METIAKGRRLKLPARGALGYTAAAALIKSIGMLTTPLFTRLLGADEYGSYSLYMSALGVISVGLSAFFSSGVVYKGLQSYKGRTYSFLASGIGVAAGISLLICIVLFTILPFLGLERSFAPIMALQLFLDSVVALRCAEYRYCYSYRRVALLGLCSAILSPLLGVAFISGAGLSYMGRILGILLSSVCIATPVLIVTLSRGRSERQMRAFLLKQGAPLLPHTMSGAAWGQLDKLLISSMLGVAALAKYSVAHSLGVAISLVTGGVSSALLPWTMRKLATGEVDTVRRINGGVFSALGCGILLVVGLAPEVMSLLAPIEYADAVEAVAPIAISTLPAFAISVFASGAIFKSRSGLTVIPSLFGVLSSFLLCLLLLPRLDFFGAGVALLLSECLSLSVCLLLARRVGGEVLIESRIIVRTLFFVALFSVALVFLYPSLPSRLLLLTAPLSLALRELFDMRRLVLE